MSAIERAYRVDITTKDVDGAWSVMAWSALDPVTSNRHESACFWTSTPGEARKVWQELNAGRTPADLVGSLEGWGGMVISPVQVWRRFRRAEGWSPWEQHVMLEGTDEIRTGACSAPEADPRYDDVLRGLLGMPPAVRDEQSDEEAA